MRTWIRTLLLCTAALGSSAGAAEYTIQITDTDGMPVAGTVVYLEALEPPAVGDAGTAAAVTAKPGIMDQVDRQFLPHILVVQRGAQVAFPNSDSIKHHVYSFSRAKTFEIRLYSGSAAEPVTFDSPGEVELGCNVHDWMLGYILVVDTPYFARAGNDGIARIDAPANRYRIGIWHPRIKDDEQALTRETRGREEDYRIRLGKPLLPPYDPESAGEFDDY